MAGPSSPRRGWPFLVARGRYHGYRTLLAPDVLLAARDYGVLDDSLVPSTVEDQAQVMQVVTAGGRPLTVVHATHRVTAADVAEPGTEALDRPPRDEYGRPLALMYGYVCEGGGDVAPQQADLAFCRETALGVYRRFLGDEEGFAVEPGPAFPLRSAVAVSPGVGGEGPRHAPTRSTRFGPPPGRRLIAAAILAAVVILVYVVWAVITPPPPPGPTPTPTPTSTSTTPEPQHSCPSPDVFLPTCPPGPYDPYGGYGDPYGGYGDRDERGDHGERGD
ncbi:hypothetical protein AB0B01_03025 [Streptomyces sp. NPDC044571]|uniref:hypothetical protein n=1 Tax=Streptomyces sp. NPDC044571 TaxID=3155371 RepID=UPI0033DE5176